MHQDNPRVLVISSCSPSIGPAIIGEQFYEALCRKGLDVDLMLKNPEPNHPEYLYVVDNDYEKRFWFRLKRKIRWMLVGGYAKVNGHCFFYTKEKYPPIPSQLVVEKIKKKYDLVLIVFWQELLSFETIEKIYDKLHCQIHFLGVDYSQMSGGCHFTGDCKNYKTGCGTCPAFLSRNKNDFTAWNVRYRKKIYEKVRPIVYGNQYMHGFYNQSFLLKDARTEMNASPIIDTNVFRPLPIEPLRKKYKIPKEKKHIIFFGCQLLDDPRKGMKYLFEALDFLYEKMGDAANSVLVIAAGRNFDLVKDRIPFDVRGRGYVAMNELPEIFSLATCFVCPSVNDAGPMMVNQSLCCGTPVVGFEMGATLQVVKDKGTGVCVKVKDSNALADGIQEILQMNAGKYSAMSQRCREIAMQTSSYEAQGNKIISIYQKYLNRQKLTVYETSYKISNRKVLWFNPKEL